jgi:ABC-type transport system substrate-binding protein
MGIGMRNRRLAAALVTAVLIGCTTAPEPSPTPSAPVQAAGEIVVGLATPVFAPPPFFTISNTTSAGFRPPGARPDLATQLVYNGLYRYDDSLAPVPDLAAEPCEVAADQVTITCVLVETTFHDGTPLTADDVAYTFELGRRHPDCLWAFGECFGDVLESVTALDERTVEFKLSAPDATFLTLILPSVMIDSRAVIEAAYAPLGELAPSLDPAEYHRAADAIFEPLGSDAPDCEAPLADAEALLQAAAVEPLPRDQFNQADGAFDACMYAEWSAVLLDDLARSLEATGLDAIALAYQALSFNRAPVGTGPWRFVGVEDGTRAIFEAFEGYHLGPPATSRIELRVIRDIAAAPDAMRNGELHWLTLPFVLPEMYDELRGEADMQFVNFPDATYFMLAYNLRDEMLFADGNLRAAVELCIDKPATVDAATDGTGDVLYSPVDPISWAYQPDLPRPERDVGAARELIEASGWVEGDDGIYARDGRRLATDVFVSGDAAQRVEFMDLVAEQTRDCGIELIVVPADTDTVLAPILDFPHVPVGYDEPFDAIFLGWAHGFDPHDDLWHSRSATSAEQPQGLNFMGFSNPRVDELLDEGIATYDQRERARIYRELQEVLAEERPVLFGWSARVHEALDARIGLTDGELNLSSRQWFWQLEKLVLRDGQDGAD